VVLWIIALLAALLVPVFFAARGKAWQTGCLSNTRSLGLAFQCYRDDADGRNPGSGLYTEASMAGWVWAQESGVPVPAWGSLFPYVRSAAVYRCPAAAGPLAFTMNGALGFLPEAGVRAPASTLLLIEEAESPGWPNDGAFLAAHLDQDRFGRRHFGGGTMAFCDGHVRWQEWRRRFDLAAFVP